MFFKNITLLADAIQKGIFPALETFECPFDTETNPTGVIRITFPEFTCVCPKTGYPDFAVINLYYLPGKLCLELKSWKIYLNSFRMVGTFHETVTAHLFTTVTKILNPKWLLLVGDFLPRGNMDTTIVFETDTLRPAGADILIGRQEPHCKGI